MLHQGAGTAPTMWRGCPRSCRRTRCGNAQLLRKAAAQIPGCGHGKGCGDPDRLHPDHRPQLVQPWAAESLSKGIEVLHPENFLGGLLLLLALPLHHPQKSLAYPDAERVQQEDEAEERMKQKFV